MTMIKKLCTYGQPEERKRTWLLRFVDTDKGECVFTNQAVALEVFDAVSKNWACTLFETVEAEYVCHDIGGSEISSADLVEADNNSRAEHSFMSMLRSRLSKLSYVSGNPRRRDYAPKVFVKLRDGLPGPTVSVTEYEDAMLRLMADGAIHEKPIGGPHSKRTILALGPKK